VFRLEKWVRYREHSVTAFESGRVVYWGKHRTKWYLQCIHPLFFYHTVILKTRIQLPMAFPAAAMDDSIVSQEAPVMALVFDGQYTALQYNQPKKATRNEIIVPFFE
jgi:hypothetical protein